VDKASPSLIYINTRVVPRIGDIPDTDWNIRGTGKMPSDFGHIRPNDAPDTVWQIPESHRHRLRNLKDGQYSRKCRKNQPRQKSRHGLDNAGTLRQKILSTQHALEARASAKGQSGR
jgi:hypothetical protein